MTDFMFDAVSIAFWAITGLTLIGVLAFAGRKSLDQVVAFVLTIYVYLRATVDDKNDLIIRLMVQRLGMTPDDAIKSAQTALDAVERALKEAVQDA